MEAGGCSGSISYGRNRANSMSVRVPAMKMRCDLLRDGGGERKECKMHRRYLVLGGSFWLSALKPVSFFRIFILPHILLPFPIHTKYLATWQGKG